MVVSDQADRLQYLQKVIHPSFSSQSIRMSSLHLADLDPVYRSVSHEEAIAIANLGAQIYMATKDKLLDIWSEQQTAGEGEKAEAWRQEGGKAMLESLKSRLAAIDNLQGQLSDLEAARQNDRIRAEQRLLNETEHFQKELINIKQLQSQTLENEFARRQADSVRLVEERKDLEAAALRLKIATLTEEAQTSSMLESSRSKKLSATERELSEQIAKYEEFRSAFSKELAAHLEEAKVVQALMIEKQNSEEISSLRLQLAELKSQGEMLALTEESRSLLAEKIVILEAETMEKQKKIEQLLISTTKSSHAIGKDGESLVLDVIRRYVLPMFLYSDAKDVHGIPHAADIHLSLQSPVGKQVKILIDAKKYKDAVRSTELRKLHSDVDRDDEATAGILISTNSVISSVKQFQIEKTPKGKYILYLSVDGFDDELRGQSICWAVRILSTLASYSDGVDDNIMSKLADFFKEMDLSVKEADKLVTQCQKAVDLATTMKKNLSKRLEDFRVENLGDMVLLNADPIEPVAKTTNSKLKSVLDTIEIIPHEEKPAGNAMQRYYQANRNESLVPKKARGKKKDESVI